MFVARNSPLPSLYVTSARLFEERHSWNCNSHSQLPSKKDDEAPSGRLSVEMNEKKATSHPSPPFLGLVSVCCRSGLVTPEKQRDRVKAICAPLTKTTNKITHFQKALWSIYTNVRANRGAHCYCCWQTQVLSADLVSRRDELRRSSQGQDAELQLAKTSGRIKSGSPFG